MGSNLAEFMRSRYGARLLTLGIATTRPGTLLQMDWGLIFDEARVVGDRGPAWDCIGKTEADYPSALADANLIQESIADTLSVNAAAAVPQYGLSATAGLTSGLTASVKATGLKARVFTKPIAAFELMQELLKLKKTHPDRWRWVNNTLLVTESFYVTSFTAEFKDSGGVTARAAYQAGAIKLDPSLSAQWVNNSTLQVSGVPTVPFAVRGNKV